MRPVLSAAGGAEELGLLTDLYELTMAQSYLQHGMSAPATFSLFIRTYPANRSYFVSAGIEDVLNYLEEWHLPEESIDYLHSTRIFSPSFLDYLSSLRFTGDVWAIPEGRLFFADEPVLEVTGPVIEAQIVETFIINQINIQSLIATKAARCVWAAKGKSLADFSLRRTHGTDAGMKAARASYIAGFQSTSNVLAGKIYGIPLSGTMAHSYVSSHEPEIDAFRNFVRSFPERSILLIDTYDTIAGARNAAEVGKEMEALGQRLQGVRLDSGDFDRLSRQVRVILDRAGLHYTRIVASGGLDESDIYDLVSGGAPIDVFGVGTKMGVSADAPWSDMAYKLVKYDGRPVFKLSTGKSSLPGEKQVFRLRDDKGDFSRDIITLRDEHVEGGEPLLCKVMERGKAIRPLPLLDEMRERFKEDFSHLDDRFKALQGPHEYEVALSPRVKELYDQLTVEVQG
ncbi:MAG: nicotinate phosphoribosyltransferase [Dehalococcoidia bacterium]|nr:nicotinate phosphoribosyltransferase [Dehalococcoidia bacterium]